MDPDSKQFYTFGVQVDTYSKYVIVYCFVNSLLRSAYRDILEDITKTKSRIKKELED